MDKVSGSARFIMVAGGVISGVGKGVATASIGKILQEHGYNITIIKIDPYINYDAGTLRPTEHGEVWVTHDGGEIDQDLGTYERFLDQDIPKKNNITTGQIYKTVIDRERQGGYLGKTVQFVPHITNEVIARIKDAAQGYDIVLIEIGGTVGDYENVPYLFAIKSLERALGASYVYYVLVTYLPVPGHIQEMKTKPTQQAIRLLSEQGIMPDMIICRSKIAIDAIRKRKIEEFAHIEQDNIIAAPDVQIVYQVPLLFEQQHVGQKILAKFGLPSKKVPYWLPWQERTDTLISTVLHKIRIGIVGKYLEVGDFSLTDSYVSIYHALLHAAAMLKVAIDVVWINAQDCDDKTTIGSKMVSLDGIIVPGGFGSHGVEGKINIIEYARLHTIPFLGICYGMQLAVVEFARNVCHLPDAHTAEVNDLATNQVVTVLPLQQHLLNSHQYGGTMRLGSYICTLVPKSRVAQLYASHMFECTPAMNTVVERHRHRYEVNPAYIDQLHTKGLLFSGFHIREQDGVTLMEFLELSEHPYFVATQAHPEFKSRFGNPHPLFCGLLQEAYTHSQLMSKA